jgi:peroxiredoxin
MCSYRDRAEDFAALDAAVAKAYSASARMGTKRAVVVIDEDGIVRHRHDHLHGLDYQSVDEKCDSGAGPESL